MSEDDEDDVYKKMIDTDLEKNKPNQSPGNGSGRRSPSETCCAIREMEQKFDATRARLREHGEADEKVWEQLTNGVEDMWTTWQCTLQDTVTTFKEEKYEKERRKI